MRVTQLACWSERDAANVYTYVYIILKYSSRTDCYRQAQTKTEIRSREIIRDRYQLRKHQPMYVRKDMLDFSSQG